MGLQKGFMTTDSVLTLRAEVGGMYPSTIVADR